MIPDILDKSGTLVHRAHVLDIMQNGDVLVSLDDCNCERRVCEMIQTIEGETLELHGNDHVLVIIPGDSDSGGYIIGRIGANPAQKKKRVVIDATDELTIRCGNGSINIDKDGRILIKGLEIVSSAKGKNRIRGGSIQLN